MKSVRRCLSVNLCVNSVKIALSDPSSVVGSGARRLIAVVTVRAVGEELSTLRHKRSALDPKLIVQSARAQRRAQDAMAGEIQVAMADLSPSLRVVVLDRSRARDLIRARTHKYFRYSAC